jgi:hypothetical protein
MKAFIASICLFSSVSFANTGFSDASICSRSAVMAAYAYKMSVSDTRYIDSVRIKTSIDYVGDHIPDTFNYSRASLSQAMKVFINAGNQIGNSFLLDENLKTFTVTYINQTCGV